MTDRTILTDPSTGENSDQWLQQADLHCEACWDLIAQEDRKTYFRSGLCEDCDARLSPYSPHDEPGSPSEPFQLI
ncbi:MAG: hypothetical protein QOK29_4353 [Rhodospirillaceae bacterium]|jgi:hypothetical protein|nr:hypothetical protein [Rhodospirillaceae bacterium]